MNRIGYLLIIPLAISFISAFSAQAQTRTVPEANGAVVVQSGNAKSLNPGTAAAFRSEPAAKDPRTRKTARENAKRLYKAGVKYGEGGLYRQALQSFQEAIKYDPEFPDAYYGLGQACLDLGRFNEAIEAFETVLKLNPKAVDAYAGLGEAHARLKQEKSTSELRNDASVGERVAFTAGAGSEAVAKNATAMNSDLTRIYKVGVGDVLDIRVAGSPPDDSTLFTVSSSGLIEHPILNQPIKVQGLTTNEISEIFAAELKRRSITAASNPEVGVRDYNSHTVLVSGLVKEPGTKILRREAIPLYVVLADAQPLPEAALVTVISQSTTKSRTFELSDVEQTTLLVLPGDVITVQPAVKRFFYVGGEVKAPGELPFRQGLTLTQAIFSAGGVTPRGEKAQLARGRGDGLLTLKEFKLKEINKGKIPDPLVEPGDRIMVLP